MHKPYGLIEEIWARIDRKYVTNSTSTTTGSNFNTYLILQDLQIPFLAAVLALVPFKDLYVYNRLCEGKFGTVIGGFYGGSMR